MAFDESQRDDLLDRLVEEFAARLRRGERPALKEYAARYPDLADEIRELFPAMVEVEQAKEICHYWDEDEAERAAAAPPPVQVGDYRIVREIGRGGMGVVYQVVQVSLDRRVALKVLPLAGSMDSKQLQRFHLEAHPAACLHHTKIVPIDSVGCERAVPYYAMQFIEDRSLAQVIEEQPRLEGIDRVDRTNATTTLAGLVTHNCAGRTATERSPDSPAAADHSPQTLGMVGGGSPSWSARLNGRFGSIQPLPQFNRWAPLAPWNGMLLQRPGPYWRPRPVSGCDCAPDFAVGGKPRARPSQLSS
jgi:hypothetical protein